MARWDHRAWFESLNSALAQFDRRQSGELAEELLQHLATSTSTYDVEHARQVLQALRNKRYFALMERVADAFLRTGIRHPQIARQYAQSMLDRGNVTGAAAVLEDVTAVEDVTTKEGAEARGLLGRAFKQIYMDARRTAGAAAVSRHLKRTLLAAYDAYAEVYRSDRTEHLWHGINAVSLLVRAERDGIDVEDRDDARVMAREVADAVGDKRLAKEATMWDLATGAEAHVALAFLADRDAVRRDELARAADYLRAYVAEERADAFELASTTRQLEEVWQLDRDEGEERLLLDLLRAELLDRTGGEVRIEAERVRAMGEASAARERGEGLQALLEGGDRPWSHDQLLTAVRRARAVGRVWWGGRGFGSGFLMDGAQLHARWAGKQLFVTNNHVISSDPDHILAIQPHQAEVTFDVLHGGGFGQPRYRVAGAPLFESVFKELDVTLVELTDRVDGAEPLPLARPRDMPMNAGASPVNVIGHPRGEALSYSFTDNKLIAFDETRLHYRSPTEKGSSGSPLFNRTWDLIGIHHAGGKAIPRLDDPQQVYEANEGILLPAVVDAIAMHLAG
ncbi:MAG: serine protease [Sandaracinaceae bacterium]